MVAWKNMDTLASYQELNKMYSVNNNNNIGENVDF